MLGKSNLTTPKVCEAFGVEYIYIGNARPPHLLPGDILTHNIFNIFTVLCQKRLLVVDADERLATFDNGELTTNSIAFYVHPEATSALSGLKNAVKTRLGGEPVSTDFVGYPKHMVYRREIAEAVDQTLREEEFGAVAELVERLRPRT